jgi:hypothetical protein
MNLCFQSCIFVAAVPLKIAQLTYKCEENKKLKVSLAFQWALTLGEEVRISELEEVKRVDDRQKVVLCMELRETESKLAIANGKIEFAKAMMEIRQD